MIILYCYDVAERQIVHNYFRDHGITIDAVPLNEFRIRSYAADTEALLIVGDTPPGFVSTLNTEPALFTVGKYQLLYSTHFRDYDDPVLLEMLSVYSSGAQFFSYNDILFGKSDAVLFLGYDLKLNARERAILKFLVQNSDRDVWVEELAEICIGDYHCKSSAITKYISQINRKAVNIGGRKMIFSPSAGFYRIKKYI